MQPLKLAQIILAFNFSRELDTSFLLSAFSFFGIVSLPNQSALTLDRSSPLSSPFTAFRLASPPAASVLGALHSAHRPHPTQMVAINIRLVYVDRQVQYASTDRDGDTLS
jgi:hypothetical protein